MKLELRHLREMGCCAKGSRNWAEQHGLDWREFVRNGLDIEIFEQFDDAFARRAVELVRKEQAAK